MDIIEKFIRHLEDEKETCQKNAIALNLDDRADEADFAKVQANIFGIVASVCRAAKKQVPENPVACIRHKIQTIPEAWTASLMAAQQHGDHAKETVERLKLSTMARAGAALSALLEESP